MSIFINHTLIKNYSYSCIDFINKLLISDYKKRLGYKNIDELKKHSWFEGFDWIQLESKQMLSPFSFYKNDFNNLFCNKFLIPINLIRNYKIKSKSHFYLKAIKTFNFVNMFILNNISYFLKNK